jgi:hypothetical protein
MDKRKLKYLFIIFFTTFVFSFVYFISINIFDKSNESSKMQVLNLNGYQNSKAQFNTDSNSTAVVSRDAKVIYNTKYKKSGDIILESVATAVDFAGETKAQVEKQSINNEYKLQSFKSSELIFIRELDRYAPNKYVLGIKGEYIAIFKTDSEGNMYIEDETNDITNRKIDKLKAQDIKMLTNGDKYFECDTRDQAAALLEDYE